MSDIVLNEGARVIVQDAEHLYEKNVIIRMPMQGPWPVINGEDVQLGVAMADLVDGGVKLRFILDKATPEAFDLEVSPSMVKVRVELYTDSDGVVGGAVHLEGI